MERLKILFIGNSFAVDTTEHAADIALNLGMKEIKISRLYVGGCCIEDYKISDAIRDDAWDIIVIQHGTKDKSCYTKIESYEKLPALVSYVKNLAPMHTKIAFNLTWLGESTRQHHEIISYKGNMTLMRKNLEDVTKLVLEQNPSIDFLIPTGTAIENARTSKIGLLTRDCFHLSMDKGRYIAALTMIACVTGLDAEKITWMPEGVDEYARLVAVESAKNALLAPLSVTKSKY